MMKEGSYKTIACQECGAKYAPSLSNDHCPVCGEMREISESEAMMLARELSTQTDRFNVDYDWESKTITVDV